jgi:AcrR family transcriptional regulator
MTETASPRERYRTQVREEIKAHAREQIATAGASAVSLNAIAKQMGMRGPSLYRYFAGRDDLITALVLDAYRSVRDAFRATVDTGGDPGGDAVALAHTLRRWGLDDPQRYLLVWGTPIPGYHAPDDVTAVAAEILGILIEACATLPDDGQARPVDAHLDAHRGWASDHPAPPAALRRALTFWTRLHGVLSLELAGHFRGMDFDHDVLFEAEVRDLLR